MEYLNGDDPVEFLIVNVKAEEIQKVVDYLEELRAEDRRNYERGILSGGDKLTIMTKQGQATPSQRIIFLEGEEHHEIEVSPG